MYQVKFTTAYKKSYKLMKKRGLDVSLLDDVVDLLRQGADADDRLGGWSDAKLSAVGIEQVRRASEQITQFHICHIFSSDLPRARETAEMITARLNLNITFLKEFRETNNGDLAGMLKERAKAEILCCENGKIYTNKHQTYAIRNAEIICV